MNKSKTGPKPRDPEVRFFEKVNKTGGCWFWLELKNQSGYGLFTLNQKNILAHRFSYSLVNGPIPAGLTIDHLCRVRHCVNPSHLEAVTHLVNTLRGDGFGARNARKTHCVRGHEFSNENTYVTPQGRRHCRTCTKMYMQEYMKTYRTEYMRQYRRRQAEKKKAA